MGLAVVPMAHAKKDKRMYGIIGKLIALPDERDTLIEVLLAGTKNMSGCIQYVVSKDAEDENAIWITEIWDKQESHQASMALPGVQEAIAKGKPLIASFEIRQIVEPIGGQGVR